MGGYPRAARVVLLCLVLSAPTTAYGANGGGSAAIAPTAVAASATGQTLTHTYTADATKSSGSQTIDVPAGWTAPQGTSGSAGYTTATSTGTLGDELQTFESPTTWTTSKHMELSAATLDLQEGSASLRNAIGATAQANEQWYFDDGSSYDWGGSHAGNLRVGMFVKSSVATNAGDLSWQDDDSAALGTPLDTVNIPALTANTWLYTSVTLGATTRTSVRSYGLRYSTDIGAATVNLDSPQSIFDAADGNTSWGGSSANVTLGINLSGQEGTASLRCTYAAAAVVGDKCRRSDGFSPVNIGTGTKVAFWIKPSIALNAGDLQWMHDNNVALGSPTDTVNIPALAANTWSYVVIDAPNSSNLSAASWGINMAVDRGAFTVDIDAMGKQVNANDATTNWTAPSETMFQLQLDSTQQKQGANSMQNSVATSAVAGDTWYTNTSSQNWTNYTKLGVWFRSTVATAAGDLQFAYDDNNDLASPIAQINLGALSANTWTYLVLSLTGTRTSITSYGFRYAVDVGATTINTDYLLLGPGSPTFPASDPPAIRTVFLEVTTGQTVTVTYGSGGGASGATAPGSAGVYTFTTKNSDASDGTVTALATSPTVVVNDQPSISSASDSPDPVVASHYVAFSVSWADDNAGESVRLFVCKTNALTSQATGGCAGGAWATTSLYTDASPQAATYLAQTADVVTSPNSYYAFVCDGKQVSNSCSAASAGTFSVVSETLSMTLSANSLQFGALNVAAARYATTSGGSAAESEAHYIDLQSNALNGYALTVRGDTLNNVQFPAYDVDAIGGTNTASEPGTEQFGLRVAITIGNGNATTPYAGAGFAYGATPTATSQVASGPGDGVTARVSLRYLANISESTANGGYSTILSYAATAAF